MSPTSAIVLVAHGSPDTDWRAPLEQVLADMRQRAPADVIELAFLAYNTPSLHDCVDALVAAGHLRIRIIAAFLSAGGKHLKRDIPDQVAELRSRHPAVKIELVEGALGDDPDVIKALATAALRRGGE